MLPLQMLTMAVKLHYLGKQKLIAQDLLELYQDGPYQGLHFDMSVLHKLGPEVKAHCLAVQTQSVNVKATEKLGLTV
jgi:lipoprotein NlpI